MHYSNSSLSQRREMVLQGLDQVVQRMNTRVFSNELTSQMSSHSIKDKQQHHSSYRSNRTEDQLVMDQFVNMCAEKIQAVFKGYLARKRHKKAMVYYRRARDKMKAVVLGWKTRRILNCKNIKTMQEKYRQVERNIQVNMFDANLSKELRRKKIQYLQKQSAQLLQNIRYKFIQYFDSGNWIFQQCNFDWKSTLKAAKPKRLFKKQRKGIAIVQKNRNLKQENEMNQQKQIEEENNLTNNKKFEEIKQKNKQTENFKKIKNNDNKKIQNAYQEEKPIKTKGIYVFDSTDQIPYEKPTESIVEEGIVKKEQKPKKQKKPMYDPMKAVAEAKKNKKQKQSHSSNQQIKQKSLKIQTSIIVNQQKQQIAIDARPKQIKSYLKKKPYQNEQTKEVNKKQRQITTITTLKGKIQGLLKNTNHQENNLQENSKSPMKKTPKSKVQSKVDCWGNKKKGKKYQYEKQFDKDESMITYESIYSKMRSRTQYEKRDLNDILKNQQKSQLKPSFPQPTKSQNHNKSINANINKNTIHQETYEQTRQRSIRQLNYETYMKNNGQKTKFQEMNSNLSELLQKVNLHRREQTDQQKRKQIHRVAQQKQVHRSMVEIENGYKNQYSSLYQKILCKIQLLQAARQNDQTLLKVSQKSVYFSRLHHSIIDAGFQFTLKRMNDSFKSDI